MSIQNHIRVSGRNRTKSQGSVPDSAESTVVFDLSAAPDREWTTIFHNVWEQRLDHLPLDYINIEPIFDDSTLTVVVPRGINLMQLEREFQAVARTASREHCPDDHRQALGGAA